MKNTVLFDFELIHTYCVYRKNSNFYSEFLESLSNKSSTKVHFPGNFFFEDYYLQFLNSRVGFLRRNGRLKEAACEVKKTIEEYLREIHKGKDISTNRKSLSGAYYELGYVLYLTGIFDEADTAFVHSIKQARIIKNEVGEWITTCVRVRVAFFGGKATLAEFDKTLDSALSVFQKHESNNHVAKRWVMVVQHHKFEVASFLNDLAGMKQYFVILHNNAWNQDFEVPMGLYEGKIEIGESKFVSAISSLQGYLNVFSGERLHKEEAIAEAFYYLGIAYEGNGESEMAQKTWKNGSELPSEPGNHKFKNECRGKLIL